MARQTRLAMLAALLLAATAVRGAESGRLSEFDLLAAQEAIDADEAPPPSPDSDLIDRRARDRRGKSAAPRAGGRPSGDRRPTPSETPPPPGEESIIVEASEDESLSWLVSSGTQLHRGCWYFETDGVLLHRSTAPRQNLTFLGTSTAATGIIPIAILMTTETDGFEYEPGMRLTVGRYLGRDNRNRDHIWDFSYLGLLDWESSAAVNVEPGSGHFLLLAHHGSTPGFNFAEVHTYTYTSDLNSFETNYKLRFRLGRDRLVLTPEQEWQRECTPGWTPSFFGGVRVITVDENFAFTSQGLDFNPNDTEPADTGRYEIRTNNDLVGLQIGSEIYEQHCNWSIGVRAKLGGLVNFASQQSYLQINATPAADFPAFREASTTQLAFLAELGLVATYNFRPNIALRASYDFLYLQGMALGPQQLQFNFSAPPEVVSGNHIFYDGASVGLEINW